MNLRDPYFDENIGDLRNLLGAQSSKELQEREPQIVFANELVELLAIHRQLFKNVYDWTRIAGTVNIELFLLT